MNKLNPRLPKADACAWSSDLEQEKPRTKLPHITPEMAAAASFRPTLNSLCPATCPSPPATATPQVQEDVFAALHLKQPVAAFTTPCFRANLFYPLVGSRGEWWKRTLVSLFTVVKKRRHVKLTVYKFNKLIEFIAFNKMSDRLRNLTM